MKMVLEGTAIQVEMKFVIESGNCFVDLMKQEGESVAGHGTLEH